jgi:hypothetical protein
MALGRKSLVLLSDLCPRVVAAEFLMKSARKPKSLIAILVPVRRGLVLCFLQLLFLTQNRLEVGAHFTKKRSIFSNFLVAGVDF